MNSPRGKVASVEDGSPAMRAGIRSGDVVLEVDGQPVYDILDWFWRADGPETMLTYEREGKDRVSVKLQRDEMESWGIAFDDPLFDGVMPCCNNCTFCFMKMLPDDARPSLKERDDDFRLSFIQGNFVTFTNLKEAHVERIIEQCISPLRFSLHASDPAIRTQMIGPRAHNGLEVAEELLGAGITLHAQIVLVPDVNDGPVLEETLSWAWERPGIANVGIVPLGYTDHQDGFTHGFDTPSQAQAVLDVIEPFRVRALRERGHAWAYASDEFYRKAYGHELLTHLPTSDTYGDFDLYEDGIGMIRSFTDDWLDSYEAQLRLAEMLERSGLRAIMVSGEATREFLDPLVAASPLQDVIEVVHVHNDYFGGNVDVTGLLCGCDIVRALRQQAANASKRVLAFMPNTILNADGVTLDDMTLDQVSQESGVEVHVVSCQPSCSLDEITAIIEQYQAKEGGL